MGTGAGTTHVLIRFESCVDPSQVIFIAHPCQVGIANQLSRSFGDATHATPAMTADALEPLLETCISHTAIQTAIPTSPTFGNFLGRKHGESVAVATDGAIQLYELSSSMIFPDSWDTIGTRSSFAKF